MSQPHVITPYLIGADGAFSRVSVLLFTPPCHHIQECRCTSSQFLLTT
nr:hypothetical protein I308_01650 [Cryptococcus tetragattii IND107]